MNRKILVTGGAGFIGGHLCRNLIDQGDAIVCLDNFDPYYDPAIKRENVKPLLENDEFRLVEGDIRDHVLVESLFRKENFDCVVHLAARAGVRASLKLPQLYEEVNVLGTLNLLDAARDHGKPKFVFGSSSSVYGVNPKTPFSEDDPIDLPISPYAASKRSAELYCHIYNHLYGLSIVGLRFFTVYGPRQRPEMAIHKFAELILKNEPIPVFGNGSSRRDYTYIDDIIAGICASIELDCGFEIINLGDNKTISLMELIHLIEGVMGLPAELEHRDNQPGDVPITYADITKAKKLLDYKPKIMIKEGIVKFARWFLDNVG